MKHEDGLLLIQLLSEFSACEIDRLPGYRLGNWSRRNIVSLILDVEYFLTLQKTSHGFYKAIAITDIDPTEKTHQQPSASQRGAS